MKARQKEERPKKSLLDKIIIPGIIILTISIAFLLTLKKKIVTLLTGLATYDASTTTLNIGILIFSAALVFLIIYRLKK